MGHFLTLNKAHHPPEVLVIYNSSIVTGLLGIFPVELLRRDGDFREGCRPSLCQRLPSHMSGRTVFGWWDSRWGFLFSTMLFNLS
jgi:hypothetical protein